jgi:hypothetical protein
VNNVPNQGGRNPLPSVAAGRYGSGTIVCTSMDVGCGINDSCEEGGSNNAAYFQGSVDRTQPEDVKFAYNIISWSFAHTAEHKDVQRSGRSFEDLIPPPTTDDWVGASLPKGPMLAEKWRFPPEGIQWGARTGFITSQPVMSKGVIVVGGPDGVLYCFDGEPTRDLDNDGDPDDGARDLSEGQPYDLIWKADVSPGGQLSTPLIVSVAGVNDGTPFGDDLVYVVSRDAQLYAYYLWPVGNDGFLLDHGIALFGPIALSGDSGATEYSPNAEANGEIPGIPSPAYSEGKLYITGPSGPLWEIDAYDGTPTEYGALYAGEAQSSPSCAYIRDEFSGAVERVLYVPYAQPESGGGTGGMKSYLLDVRNERLTPGRTGGIYYTRYHYGTDQRGRFDIYGDSYPLQERRPRVWLLAGGTGSPEKLSFNWQQAQSQFWVSGMMNPGDSVYADYSIDPSSSNFWRTREAVLSGADMTDPVLSLGGSVAVGPGDYVFYGTKNSLAYCLMDRYLYPKPQDEGEHDREVARWRYLLTPNAGTAEAGDVPFTGTPAVGQDYVFMTAFARVADPVPGGWLVAFERDPTIKIRTQREILDTAGVSLKQESPFTGQDQSINPDQYTVVSGNEIIIGNLDDPKVGPAAGAQKITLPARSDWPLVVRYPSDDPSTMGQGEEHSLGSHPGDHLDPKVWEAYPLPARCSTGPSLVGDYVFVPMDSGDVWVFPADPSKIDPDVGESIEGNWPNLGPDGLGWFSVQTPAYAPGDPSTWIGCGLAAANGLLAVSNYEGLIVYDNQHTVVADNNRVIELTPSGRAVWACDATTTKRVAGGDLPISGEDDNATGVIVAETTPLSRPRTVKKFGEDSYVVADSGNNRVVQFDKSGTVTWELKGFYDPRGLLPSGSPLFLNSPTDFTVFSKTVDYGGGLVLYEVHYIIVDSGNYRILELATGFDQSGRIAEDPLSPGNPFDRVVIWASTTASVGEKYSYSNALRVELPEIDANYNPQTGLYPVTVACVANTRFGAAGQTYSGGTILFLDSDSSGYSKDPGKPIKFGDIPINGSSIIMPDGSEQALAAPTHIDLYEVVGNDTSSLQNYMWVIADSTTMDDPNSGEQIRVGVVFIAYLSAADGRLHLATDVNGNGMVYNVWLDALHGDAPVPFVHPTCVKKIGSGGILVTDYGANRVLTFDPVTGRGIAIAPPVSGTADLNQPTFADRSF